VTTAKRTSKPHIRYAICRKDRSVAKLPKTLSPGEETLVLHLTANGITAYQREAKLIPDREWRVDFLLGENLVVEVEGGTSWGKSRHSYGKGFEDDATKYNALTMAGYSVLRYSTEMVQRGEAIRDIMQLVPNTGGKQK
jgi:very-short-patch-repair endonuclease